MAIFNRKKDIKPVVEERDRTPLSLLFNSFSGYSSKKAQQLAAVFCATEQISSTIAMLPFNVVKYDSDEKRRIDHPMWRVLNVKPNDKWTPFGMWKSAIEHIIFRGAAYFYIERDEKLNVKSIKPIENEFIQPFIQPDGSVKYLITGIQGAVDASEVIDLAMHRDEMYRGISLLTYADMTLRGAMNAEKTSDNFFKSGAGLSGILKSSATLTKDQKDQIRESWNQCFASDKARGIAILPQGIDFQPVSISPKDSMLLDSRKWGVIEISRFWNISPIRIFDLSEVSYSSMEATNMSYLSDTIRPYVEMMCDEFNLKLVKPSEVGTIGFATDFTEAMQTNKQSLAEYYRTLLTNGILSIDDIRGELGYPKLGTEAGRAHFMQISYGSAEDIAAGKYIKPQNQSTQQDNKVG